MKKIVLLLAAVAALASCVKENTFEQTQPADGLVTIKAIAMDTKTTLGETTGEEGSRQTAVLWEATDKIMVVYEGPDDSEYADYWTEFSVTEFDGSSATFHGTYDTESFTPKDEVRPIAVYPSSSVIQNPYDYRRFVIKHNLPEVQDGKDLSGLLLSTAVLKDEDLMEGTATATFNNALTLLKVVVPEGVKSVALTSDKGLVGDAQFTVSNTYSESQVWDDDSEGYVTNVTEATGKLSGLGNENTVTLSDGGEELDAKTYHVLIYPHNASTFKVTMTGMTDDVKYESTLTNLTFTAGEFRTLNLTKIFKMEVNETEAVSPMGGELTIPVMAAEQETYYVEENADWISVVTSTYVQTKAFTGTNIVLDIEPNTTGASRTAEVTITWGTDGERTFTISQENAYLDFVYVDGNPANDLIQWEESFGVYSSESDAQNGTNATKTYSKKTFNIELSDDPEKGTYMITNMFYADSYYDKNGQPVYTRGAKYYADYADGVLTVKKNDAGNSYHFSENINLTYDSANKEFTAAPIPTTSSNVWIGGYTVTVKEDDPGAGDSPYADLFGEYTENFADGSYYGNPAKGVLTIAESDDANYHLKMTFFGGTSAAVTVYANVDGNTITTVQPAGYTNMGTFYASTLTVSGSSISGTLKFDYPSTVSDYTATKVDDPFKNLYGEYAEEFADGSYYGNPAKGVLTIAESDDANYHLKMTFFGGTSAAVTVYANVDGNTITTVQPAGYTNMGTFYASTLTVSGSTISGTLKFDYPSTVSDYSATKQ